MTIRYFIIPAALLLAILSTYGFYLGKLFIGRKASKKLIAISATFPREYTIEVVGKPIITYVALGDSTALGTGAKNLEQTYVYQVAQKIAEQGFTVQVINRAQNGATYRDVLNHQVTDLTQLRPNLITLTAGANDVTHHTDPQVYQKDLQDTFALFNDLHDTQILLANTPNMGMVPAFPPPYPYKVDKRARSQNKILDEIPKASHIRIIDLFAGGQLDSKKGQFYANDNFHPSPEGYKRWAELFSAQVTVIK